MSKKFKKYGLIVGGIVLVIVIAVCCLWPENSTYVQYAEFKSLMEQDQIESVEISVDEVFFTIKEDKTCYRSDNPQTDNFKENLLLHGIKVTNQDSFDTTVANITDILFNVFFIGIIGVLLYKFIGKSGFKVIRKVDTRYEDIVGMEELKAEVNQVIDGLQNPDVYAKKGMRMPKGILLEGDPGNGKTLFARAIAGEGKIAFIPTKATDFASMFMAIGPAKVKKLFRVAKKHAPCIIFIDEFDGIGTKRNYSGTGVETENTRIVTSLLNELDGFEKNSGVLVVAATNNRKALDDALIRPGRFDRKYVVPYPDYEARKRLIVMYSGNKSIHTSISVDNLAKRFDHLSCAHIETIMNQAAMNADLRGSMEIMEEDIVKAIKMV